MRFPEFPIRFTDLPQGAMLNVWDSEVLMDYSFKNCPPSVITFVYYHELGHLFYDTKEDRNIKTEFNCDKVAAQQMVELGHSRIQIIAALEIAIEGSPELPARKLNLLKFLAWMPY